jgi:hypothetical protein
LAGQVAQPLQRNAQPGPWTTQFFLANVTGTRTRSVESAWKNPQVGRPSTSSAPWPDETAT